MKSDQCSSSEIHMHFRKCCVNYSWDLFNHHGKPGQQKLASLCIARAANGKFCPSLRLLWDVGQQEAVNQHV